MCQREQRAHTEQQTSSAMALRSMNPALYPAMTLEDRFLIASIEWQLRPHWTCGEIGNTTDYFDRFEVHLLWLRAKTYNIYASDYDATESDEKYARAPRSAFGSTVAAGAQHYMNLFEQTNVVNIHHYHIRFGYLPEQPGMQTFHLYYAVEKADLSNHGQ